MPCVLMETCPAAVSSWLWSSPPPLAWLVCEDVVLIVVSSWSLWVISPNRVAL